MIAAALLIVDQRGRGILNLTSGKRKRRQEALLAHLVERQRILEEEEEVGIAPPPINDLYVSNEVRNRNVQAGAADVRPSGVV